MRSFASLSLIYLLLVMPMTANADPKTDIAAYEKAFDSDDIENAKILLSKALDNAASLPPDSPYLARIAFENAYYFCAFSDYDKAYAAMKIVDNAFKLKPELQNGSDIDEYNFISAFLKFLKDDDKKHKSKNADALNKAIDKIKNEERSDNILFESNFELENYYIKNGDWYNLGIASQRQIDMLVNSNTLSSEESTSYSIVAYLNRGQAKFAKQVGVYGSSDMKSLIPQKGYPLWADAMADILFAKKKYGTPKTIDDKYAAIMDGWVGLILSYARTKQDNNYVNNKVDEIKKVVGWSDDSIFDKNEEICKGKISANFKFTYRPDLLQHYSFGYVKALYDINSDNKVTNFRLLSAYPDNDFGESIEYQIKSTKITTTTDNIPKECLKDQVLRVHFITY